MGIFKSTRTFPYSADLAAVAKQIMEAFRADGFEATGDAIDLPPKNWPSLK